MFSVLKQDKQSNARTGILKTAHGAIKTPTFMPCGTHGAVKTVTPDELKDIGVDILLGNTYHLYLRPGDKEIKKLGGLHNFMKWNGPILTDSGGYQVFSLGKEKLNAKPSTLNPKKNLVKIKETGIEFRSHLDGSKHFFTPEKVIDIQKNLGSDIMMVLDECAPYPCSKKHAKEAMERTHNWAEQALRRFNLRNAAKVEPSLSNSPLLFGIVQGSTFKDLREESANFITSLPFDGIAIGGVSVGEGKGKMYQALDWVTPILHTTIRPRAPLHEGRGSREHGREANYRLPIYLMGVGTPEDILEAVERGIDMFDCVLPTRLARHGSVWSCPVGANACPPDWRGHSPKTGGRINLLNAKFKTDKNPIMKNCNCYTCRGGFSRAYLHHLLKENEVLGIRLATIHNLHFILDLMRKIRDNIDKGTFGKFKKEFLKNWR